MNGYSLALLLLVAGAAAFLWMHRWLARLITVAVAFIAVLSVAAIPEWRNALATVFGSGPGLLVLFVLAVAFAGFFAVDLYRHHHPVRSSIFGVIAGLACVMAWAMHKKILHQGRKLLPKTGAALNQAMNQIGSGQAMTAESRTTVAVVLVIGALILIMIFALMHKHHKSRPFKSARAFGEMRALPAGTGGGGGKKPGLLKRITGVS